MGGVDGPAERTTWRGEAKAKVRPQDALLAEKDAKIQRLQQSNLRYIDRTVHCRELLAEAAEVLKRLLDHVYDSECDACVVGAELWAQHAKPLLDKLEGK